MRLALTLLVVLFAACSGKAATGPAWPKATAREIDGGESLAPRTRASAIVAAVPDDDDDAKTPEVAVPDDADTPAEVETPDVSAPALGLEPSDDELIITDDIVIEIDDDD